MAWSDIFLPAGAQTQAEADANFAAQQAALAAKLKAHANDGTINPTELAQDQALLNESLDSTDLGALEGAVQGATELVTDPTQWSKDMQTGATMVGNGINTAGKWTLGLIWKAVPIWVWGLGALGLFLWMGGGAWLAGSLKGRLQR